jgi:DNA invertase Pin-like site-specific DNA recombinase
LSAEIERNLISQRTKEALARMKSEGIHIGRPQGAKSKEIKLTGKEEIVSNLVAKKISKIKIAKMMGVHRSTLRRFMKEME